MNPYTIKVSCGKQSIIKYKQMFKKTPYLFSLKDRGRQSLHLLAHLSNAQLPGILSRFPTWVAGTAVYEPSPAF